MTSKTLAGAAAPLQPPVAQKTGAIAGHGRGDVDRPEVDAAGEGLGVEASLAEEERGLQRTPAVVAVDDNRRPLVRFVLDLLHAPGDLVEWDQPRPRDAGGLVLGGRAAVDKEHGL